MTISSKEKVCDITAVESRNFPGTDLLVVGQGIVILLEGSPGVGKTLTAEARKSQNTLLVPDSNIDVLELKWPTGFGSLFTL